MVFSIAGQFRREIFGDPLLHNPRGVAICRGMLLVTQATQVHVLTLQGETRQILHIPGARQLYGLCADDSWVYITDRGSAAHYVWDNDHPEPGADGSVHVLRVCSVA